MLKMEYSKYRRKVKIKIMEVESRFDGSVFLIANNTIVEYFYLLYLWQFGGKNTISVT